jgi:UDPglucose 6-dehydrogenase/GDP-mannose 6-dehydrogenase
VVCVDVDVSKVEQINRGEAPIYEARLEELLLENVGERLSATTDLDAAVRDSEITLIAVGTPFDGEVIDLSYVRTAARQIGEVLRHKDGFHAVVVKSTVIPGTTDEVVATALAQYSGKQCGLGFGVGMNPEFLREGDAVQDFMEPDRIVLGAGDERTLQLLERLYEAFPEVDKVRTSPRTAEMIKYAANSLLATLISFSNEIGNLCSVHSDLDVVEVLSGVHLDKRLSPILADGSRIVPQLTTYVEAGCGFGGSCFPKDVKALAAHGEQAGAKMRLLESVLAINAEQPGRMVDLLREQLPVLQGQEVAVLGLAFKPGTDDTRESPAIEIVELLIREGAAVRVYDPVVGPDSFPEPVTGTIQYADSLVDAVEGVEAVLLVTKWPEFAELPALLSQMSSPPMVVDGRRMLSPDSVKRYAGIGLKPEHS